MKVEQLIEEAMQDILEARTYISTNSIPVILYRDRLTEKDQSNYCVVHANPLERLQPNYNHYWCELHVSTVVNNHEDNQGANLNALYQDVLEEIQTVTTTTTLQNAINAIDAASGITIDGFVYPEVEETDTEEISFYSVPLRIALTYQP